MNHPQADPPLSPERLAALFNAGKELDLSGCVYEPGSAAAAPSPYYFFLAGFVRGLGLSRVMEVGTHYAGSTLAMRRGVRSELADDCRIVTSDVTSLNVEETARHRGIIRLHGDSLDPGMIDTAVKAFDRHIDLLYVDTVHTYMQTLENVAVYANRLKPRFIILDDIRLNEDMRALWSDLRGLKAGRLFDVSELVERDGAGFGVIECTYPFAWPELSPAARQAWRAAWRLRRFGQSALPEQVRAPTRRLAYRLADRLRRR